jgi:hypothetical protein
MPQTQVAHYAAVAAGLGIVLWLCGSISRTPALLLALGGIAMILLTHTRTALLALVVGVVFAALALFLSRRRVRRVVTVTLIVAPLTFIAFAPAVAVWFNRDQNAQAIAGLSGRKRVWTALVNTPRPQFNRLFGSGLSNESFNGDSIDSTWLAVYLDQGLVGDAIVGAILLYLLVASAFRRTGAARSVAIFLIVYCAFASYTEVTLGVVTPYLLDVTVAASLLVVPAALGAGNSD